MIESLLLVTARFSGRTGGLEIPRIVDASSVSMLALEQSPWTAVLPVARSGPRGPRRHSREPDARDRAAPPPSTERVASATASVLSLL